MNIKVSKERKIAAIIISILSLILFYVLLYLLTPIIYANTEGGIFSSALSLTQSLIAMLVPFLLSFIYYNLISKKGYQVKDMLVTIVASIVFYEGLSFIFKFIVYKLFHNSNIDMRILYAFIEIPFFILFIYQAEIAISRSPEEKEEIKRQYEEMRKQQEEQKK